MRPSPLRGNIPDRTGLTAGRSRHTPLNHAPGAVVTLMERSNVSTVLCAGQIKKWRGAIIGYDIPKLGRIGGEPRLCLRRGWH
jgi:5-methylthioadenosine/S-adenosylhomocysteine deaminase